jgi:uncharacterized protein (TIGR00369 family)
VSGLPPFPSDPTPDALEAFIAEWNSHPAMEHLRARIDLSDPEVPRAYIDALQPFHRGGMGTDAVVGAVTAGMIDLVIGLTGYLRLGRQQVGVAQLNVNFVRPVRGTSLMAEGHPTRVGRRLAYIDAQLYDDQSRLCATGSGIVAVAGSAPAGPSF